MQIIDVDNDLNGTNGIEFNSNSSSGAVGRSVSYGDINGDGVNDIHLGAEGSHRLYVIFGNRTAIWPASFNLDTDITPGVGVLFQGPGTSGFGTILANADINNDGITDIIAGADGISKVFIIYGKQGTWPTAFDVTTDLNATTGFEIVGSNNFGRAVAGGDINNDGIKDIIVGMESANKAFVVYGKNGTRSSPCKSGSIN